MSKHVECVTGSGCRMTRPGAWIAASLIASLAGAAWGTVIDPTAPPAVSRVREGGTPFDPNQRMTPYEVRASGLGVKRDADIWTPAEYQPSRGVLFRYFTTQWPEVVTACVAALTGPSQYDDIAYVAVTNASQQTSATNQFIAAGADMSKVVFLTVPGDSVWMRDYGPHFVFNGSGVGTGALSIVDSHYYSSRPLDNFVPTIVAEDHLRLFNTHVGLYYSGGNFQGGPNRSGFLTALINLDNPAAEGFTAQLIADLHRDYKGVDTLHILPQLPFSVDGTGHIDMWLYLVDESCCILSEFKPGSNATAISVTNNAVPYMQNLGYTVFRPPAWNVGSTHYTYANAFRVNNRIFIPVYGTAVKPGGNVNYNDEDDIAMSLWNQAVGNSGTFPYPQVDFSRPRVEIVPIQCNAIIPAAGAIHCIIKQVPRHTAPTPSVYVTSPRDGDLWIAGTTRRVTWAASDSNNATIPTFTLSYSTNGGVTWTEIATTTNSNSYDWAIPSNLPHTLAALVRVVANASDGDSGEAVSLGTLTIAPGTQKVIDFSTGAGTTGNAYGHQTLSWTNVEAVRRPAVTAVTTTNLGRMATSNATGPDNDTNRYISPTVGSNNECTHTYELKVLDAPEEIDQVDQIVVRWEGYSDNATQTELYVWDYVQGNWGNAQGLFGQNRYMANWAGNRDTVLVGRIDSDFARYIDASGTMTFLVYAERRLDESFADYMSVTLAKSNCPSDFDNSGFVDGDDFDAFVTAFDAGTDDADFDDSGFVDGDDFDAFVFAFEAGC
jgi:agmatine deiminase